MRTRPACESWKTRRYAPPRDDLKLRDIRKHDRSRGLEGACRPQHQRIGVLRADDLQADRQAGFGEAAEDRGRGLLREVEGIRKGRPVGPFAVLCFLRVFHTYVKRGDRQSRRHEEVELPMEQIHMRAERAALHLCIEDLRGGDFWAYGSDLYHPGSDRCLR